MALVLAETAVAGSLVAAQAAEQAGVMLVTAVLQMLPFPHLPAVRMQIVKDLLGDPELAAWKPVVACWATLLA